MNARLKQARKQAGFSSATAAIEACGWNSSKYRAHENGQNNYKVEDAKMYAKAYGVSSAWLLVGEDKSVAASPNAPQTRAVRRRVVPRPFTPSPCFCVQTQIISPCSTNSASASRAILSYCNLSSETNALESTASGQDWPI